MLQVRLLRLDGNPDRDDRSRGGPRPRGGWSARDEVRREDESIHGGTRPRRPVSTHQDEASQERSVTYRPGDSRSSEHGRRGRSVSSRRPRPSSIGGVDTIDALVSFYRGGSVRRSEGAAADWTTGSVGHHDGDSGLAAQLDRTAIDGPRAKRYRFGAPERTRRLRSSTYVRHR